MSSLGKYKTVIPVIPVEDLDDLRDQSPVVDGMSFLTMGTTDIGVGPSSVYFYDASDNSSVDDGDLIIVTTGDHRLHKALASVTASEVVETTYGDVQSAVDTLASDKADALVHKLDGTVNPTVDDDIDAGYTQGSLWYNTVDGKVFLCMSSLDGAADWKLLTPDLDTSGLAVNDLVSFDGVSLIKSPDGARTGFFDYNDAATAGSPIVVTGGGGYVNLTNDELGAFTNKSYPPVGVSDVWDASTDSLDFSDLKLGDQVSIRVDINVTTTAANQEFQVALELGNGGTPYDLIFVDKQYKTAGAHPLVATVPFYMGDLNTLNNLGKIKVISPSNATVVVNGWFTCVTIRG